VPWGRNEGSLRESNTTSRNTTEGFGRLALGFLLSLAFAAIPLAGLVSHDGLKLGHLAALPFLALSLYWLFSGLKLIFGNRGGAERD
jgi:hypothetical protein